jgi:hypothetical protein
MSALSTFLSIARQLARLVPAPSERIRHRKIVSSRASVGRCGRCPACRAVVSIETTDPDGAAPCPSCCRVIYSLNPLVSD